MGAMNDELFRHPNTVESTSKSLLSRVKKRDQAAWQQLVGIYGPVVAYWIRSGQVRRQDSGDVFQEVFASVAASVDRFERQEGTGKFRRWLKVITQNKVNDFFRMNHVAKATGGDRAQQQMNSIPDLLVDAIEIDPVVDLSESENALIVQSALQVIKKEFREVSWQSFWLTVMEDNSASEAGAKLGISADAVRKNKSRVMTRLREILEEGMS